MIPPCLDRPLRAARKLPEQSDFRAWKTKLHEAYRAVEAAKDTWFLPDGRALSVVTTPNPEGGVTYLFDDVTESFALRPPLRRPDPGPARDARQPRRRRRRVRQQWPRPSCSIRPSRGCGGSRPNRCASIRTSTPSNPGAARCTTTQPPGARSARAITSIENRLDIALKLRAQGRQRARLHEPAAARRRDHADVPGHHRHRECRTGPAREQRGARSPPAR